MLHFLFVLPVQLWQGGRNVDLPIAQLVTFLFFVSLQQVVILLNCFLHFVSQQSVCLDKLFLVLLKLLEDRLKRLIAQLPLVFFLLLQAGQLCQQLVVLLVKLLLTQANIRCWERYFVRIVVQVDQRVVIFVQIFEEGAKLGIFFRFDLLFQLEQQEAEVVDQTNCIFKANQAIQVLLVVQILGVLGEGHHSQLPEVAQHPYIPQCLLFFLFAFFSPLSIYCWQSGQFCRMSHSIKFSRFGVGWKYSDINALICLSSLSRSLDRRAGQPNLPSISQISLTCRPILQELTVPCIFKYLITIIDMILKQMWHLARQVRTLGQPLRGWFSSEDNNYGIKFDEQEIRRKMAEIKQRKSNPARGKTQKLEFMSTDSNSEISKAVRKYRQSTNTENLFHFNDPTLEEKPTIMQITGFDETSIEIDSMVYPPSLIIFPKQVLVWEVARAEDLSIDHFILLKYVHPKPTYVIVGLPNPALLPPSIADYLRSNFDNFDCLELFQACSQFNTMANDDIDTVGFFITK